MADKIKTNGLYKKLVELQNKIRAPKKRFNSFGNYNYRSLEDILEAVKPLLKELNLSIFFTDNISVAEERYYIRADVHLIDNETGEHLVTSAFAREIDIKKGMDVAQITGAASSYARKYALSGLLLLDDNQDPDMQDNTDNDQPQQQQPQQPQTEEFNKAVFIKSITQLIRNKKLPKTLVKQYLKLHGLNSFEDIETREEAIQLYKAFQNAKVDDSKQTKEVYKRKEAKDDKETTD